MPCASTPTVPYRQYCRKEIYNQPGLSPMDKALLLTMHELDDQSAEACYASDAYLADQLGVTEGAVRNRVSRLRAKGYVVTIGGEVGRLAYRRVVLQHEVDLQQSGSVQKWTENGTTYIRKRKTGEANPALKTGANAGHSAARLREDPALSVVRAPRSHLGERMTGSDWERTEIPPLTLRGAEGNTKPGQFCPQTFLPGASQGAEARSAEAPDNACPAAELPGHTESKPRLPGGLIVGPRDEADSPAQTMPARRPDSRDRDCPPATRQPAPDLNRPAGRAGKPWLAAFHADPGARLLAAHFGIQEIDKGLARKVMKRRRNYSTTFNTATIGYVLQHLDALRTEPLSPVPVPKTLAKFLAVFPAASDFLTAVGTQAIREQLEGRLRVLTEARPLAWHAQEFQKYCEAFKPRSFAEFFDTRPPEQIGRSGHWQREFTWAAALHFWSQGDRSVTECPAGQDLVAGQCVTSPELLGRHPELAAAAGTSVTQLLAAREAVIALLRRYLDQLRVVPSVRWLAAVEAALPTFLTDQVSNFLGTGAVEDVVPAAEQAA